MKMNIISAQRADIKKVMQKLGLREKMDMTDVVDSVTTIVSDVRENGDAAVLRYTEKFDGVKLNQDLLRVPQDMIEQAQKRVDPAYLKAMEKAAVNIMAFHRAQRLDDIKMERKKGARIGLLARPLDTVGIYIPAGTAPLPSSVLMTAIPAQAAGVGRIVLCTPPKENGNINPEILAAAWLTGVSEIYCIGGAQAIAAMAYGTKTVPRVDKICGPGNIYVNTAKRLVYGQVDIDMFAGPSEILILADKTANPAFVAADMLSQAEHDILSSAILVTTSTALANDVEKELLRQLKWLKRKDIAERSLDAYGAILVVDDIKTAIDFSNELAPEHLEICMSEPESLVPMIKNAGAIFLGSYAPEALGDYYAGTNHTLPTSGSARFFSPLGTRDFQKSISVVAYTKEALEACRDDIAILANAEGLDAHARSVTIRFEDDKKA